MTSDSNDKRSTRIPIRFLEDEEREEPSNSVNPSDMDRVNPDNEANASEEEIDLNQLLDDQTEAAAEEQPATGNTYVDQSELKRLQEENAELKDRLARRQADFENYRKRVERERSETYNRVVADVAAKLLGVVDNLKRALETEASLEASESDEFRHFLSGVDLIYKQLSGVLESLGVKPIIAVGEKFNPHIHEAVVTEASDEFEPDTVMQEIRAGYRLGDKLIRPALVKVATRG